MRTSQQRALVELLRAGRHVDGRVAREEVDRLEADFEDFAGHHGEIFDAGDLGKSIRRGFGRCLVMGGLVWVWSEMEREMVGGGNLRG